MKKTFPLTSPGKVDARVVEAVKNDVRKYVKRERRKALPEGFDVWTFDCKAGPTQEAAVACTLPELSPRIDQAAAAAAPEVYIEIIAVPGHRNPADENPPATA